MRIGLSLLLRIVVLLPSFGCRVSQPVAGTAKVETIQSWEVVVKFFEDGNAIDKINKVIDAVSRIGLNISKMEQIFLSSDKLEIRISIRNCDGRIANKLELQLRSVMKIEYFFIRMI
ncbi:MAG: hypothetical protein KF741_13085 [Ferruginibacter sp.]|nr:hypothetical protein [Bacteroidota bacterium]MBX2920171.1 hypothetical protein [Ferruginibacter sp.]